MKYRFHRAATGEHYDNVNFYEGRLPGLGADYLKEFETIMAHICTAPNFYPTIGTPDIHKAGLKRFPLSRHLSHRAKSNYCACCRTPAPPTCLLVEAFSEMMTLLAFRRIA